ncbi:MAG: aminoglycoside phosphotransferase family protein [Chloroflexota bacterium]|nr:aminoglycoside phosphotransferase family protein [Chloroflexota bacterium]MDQ3525603.1 aminoglycoside phosphotransferase family protein [Chloroflexota bacterium]
MTADVRGDGWRPAPASLSVFESVAGLYAAAEAESSTVILEAGETWKIEDQAIDTASVAIWGNTPSSGKPVPVMLRWAARREVALHRVRRGLNGLTAQVVHRLPPPQRSGAARGFLRSSLLSGLIVELHADGENRRVIDAVADAAGAENWNGLVLRPSRDGSALARLHDPTGRFFELRVAVSGGRKDPGRNGDALEALARSSVSLVPRLLGRGATAGASWTTESSLSGALPRRLTGELVQQVVRFCADLPRTSEPTSLRDRMLHLAERYPRWAELSVELAERRQDLPGVLQHGDLWSGNLLVDQGRLSGVVDWDTWHPAGLPGVDLLQLLAMQRRGRTGEDIGGLWLSGLWRSQEFLAATSDYWRALRLRPQPDLLEAIGLDWWAGQLFKRQAFAARPGWIEQNVDGVLAAVNGGQ